MKTIKIHELKQHIETGRPTVAIHDDTTLRWGETPGVTDGITGEYVYRATVHLEPVEGVNVVIRTFFTKTPPGQHDQPGQPLADSEWELLKSRSELKTIQIADTTIITDPDTNPISIGLAVENVLIRIMLDKLTIHSIHEAAGLTDEQWVHDLVNCPRFIRDIELHDNGSKFDLYIETVGKYGNDRDVNKLVRHGIVGMFRRFIQEQDSINGRYEDECEDGDEYETDGSSDTLLLARFDRSMGHWREVARNIWPGYKRELRELIDIFK